VEAEELVAERGGRERGSLWSGRHEQHEASLLRATLYLKQCVFPLSESPEQPPRSSDSKCRTVVNNQNDKHGRLRDSQFTAEQHHK
jgi:hypothetical protein